MVDPVDEGCLQVQALAGASTRSATFVERVRQVQTLLDFSQVILNSDAIFSGQGGSRDQREKVFTGRGKDAGLLFQYHHGEPAFLHHPVDDMIQSLGHS